MTPDDDGSNHGPNYGTTFEESDYRAIPKADLPFGLPAWVGDDAWGRRAEPSHDNSVNRPPDGTGHTDDQRLVWRAPTAQELEAP